MPTTDTTDHLGSICKIYNAAGTKQFDATYDAWGKQTVNVNYIGITRGYTGHEHWNQFGLIDMNGRFYDPVVGRFLSPDPYVQSPTNPQNYNRYSYCLNNPLKYTDPNGESAVLTAAIIGAVIGTYIGGTMANNTYNPIKWNYSELKIWGYMGGGAIVGAASGAAGAYVGSTVGGYFASSSFVAGSASGAAAGAVSGTISGAGYSWLDGASFKQGAWKGFVSGNVGALTGGLLGGIVGGIDAYCDGRNAWTGKEVAMGRSRLAFNNTTRGQEFQLSNDCYPQKIVNGKPIGYEPYTEKKVEMKLRNSIGFDDYNMYPTERNIYIPRNQIGPVSLQMEGSIPADCEVQIFSNGKLIQTLHGGRYYKFGELKPLKVFTKKLSIKMVGQPIMDGITIRPTFNTIITTHFRY